MADVLTFSISGDLLDRLKRAPDTLVQEVDRELKDGADRVASRAQRKLSSNKTTDEGGLSRGITTARAASLEYTVTSSARYSPFIEWGTKRRVKVPSHLRQYASQFIGSGGGSAAEALKAIMGWVRRKKIRFDSAARFKSGQRKGQNRQLTLEQTAYIIFHFIMINGIKPQPFFFPSLDAEAPTITKNIENVLKDI